MLALALIIPLRAAAEPPIRTAAQAGPPADGAGGALAAKSLTIGGALYFTGLAGARINEPAAGKAELLAQELRNLNATRTSGRVRLELIASVSRSGDFSLPYWTLGRFELDPLPAGGRHSDVDAVVDYAPPPDGDYFVYVAVLEQEPPGCGVNDYCVDDYVLVNRSQFVAGAVTRSDYVDKVVVDAVEFFHPEFGHYFVTAVRGEAALLDLGQIPGWARTGYSFKVWRFALEEQPVCRFFSAAFAPKSTHFYTPYGPECDLLRRNPLWVDERVSFYVRQVASAGSSCPVPLYRLYNNGMGGAPNHRFTSDLAVRDAMVAQGWISEGSGPLGVIACLPSR